MTDLYAYFTEAHDYLNYDYFSAPDDEAALTVFALDPEDDRPEDAGFPTLKTRGVDTYVELGHLTALLVGQPFDVVREQPRFSETLLIDPEDDTVQLVTVTDQLRDAVADVSPGELADVADRWARTGDLWGAEPEWLIAWLSEFVTLAKDARARGHRLYCLTSTG